MRAARTLRRDHRMSLSEIADVLGVSKSTLSVHLRDERLDESERKQKNARKKDSKSKRFERTESNLHKRFPAHGLTRRFKGSVAEAAVALRLSLVGVEVFSSMFDGDEIDMVAKTMSGKLLKIQVKWAKHAKHGLPRVKLVRANGEKYEVDFVVAYDLFSDTAFVFALDEVSGFKESTAVRDDAAERWDKLPS